MKQVLKNYTWIYGTYYACNGAWYKMFKYINYPINTPFKSIVYKNARKLHSRQIMDIKNSILNHIKHRIIQ